MCALSSGAMPLSVAVLLALLSAAIPPGGGAPSPAAVARLPACAAAQLSLAFDGEGGAFDGMSHSGALMVVRNLGPAACRIEGLPAVSFHDAAGRPLDIVRQVPAGMHPGPVVLPVGIAADAEATAPLRWVSGDVFGGGRCRRVASARVVIVGAPLGAALSATMCSPAGRPARFEQPVLRIDPAL